MNIERLVRMANDIGNFFKASRITRWQSTAWLPISDGFWDPRMRKEIVAYVDGGGTGLMDLVREAVLKLR